MTIGAGPATVYEPSGIDGGESNELHAGLAYSLPADQDRLVGIRAQFTIRNEGATTATVRLAGGELHSFTKGGDSAKRYNGRPSSGGRLDEYHLEPGDTWSLTWGEAENLLELLKTAADKNRTVRTVEFENHVTVFGAADQGVVDTHRLLVSGKPLAPDPLHHGRYLVAGEAPSAVAYPPTREYFSSKRSNRRFESEPAPIPRAGASDELK